VTNGSSPTGSSGSSGPPRRTAIWAVLLVVVLVAVATVAVVRWVPFPSGGSGLPAVISVLPTASESALVTAGALANNTTGGPWTPELDEGWDNTEGLGQVPFAIGNASCPVQGARISNFGILGSNASYSAGLAEGWLIAYASASDGATDLFVWVGDGNAYTAGELRGLPCAPFLPLSENGTVFTSTGAAGMAAEATNFTRFTNTFPSANATYLLFWERTGSPARTIPYWTITFNACNGTVSYASETLMYGSNGTVRYSTFGEAAGAQCGSSAGLRDPTGPRGLSAPNPTLDPPGADSVTAGVGAVTSRPVRW
jgi:hypothetical protein